MSIGLPMLTYLLLLQALDSWAGWLINRAREYLDPEGATELGPASLLYPNTTLPVSLFCLPCKRCTFKLFAERDQKNPAWRRITRFAC